MKAFTINKTPKGVILNALRAEIFQILSKLNKLFGHKFLYSKFIYSLYHESNR